LGAVKVKRGGILSYALPDQLAAADWSTGRLERILKEWVVGIEAAGQLIVIRTPPGSAHLVASAIDHAQIPEIAGTVSGDDTMFVAIRDGADIRTMLTRFERMMGQDAETETRLKAFADYQVNEALMAKSDNAFFLHCLPARRGEEVTGSVMESPKSAVWRQAENRMHTARGALAWLAGVR
jgi:arginine repressor